MRALLAANPQAGRVRGPAGVARIEEALTRAGLEVELVTAPAAEEVGEAMRAALQGRDPEDTRVVVAGGDGSIRALLPALMNTPYSLAILPVGSVNVMSRELAIPRDLAAAAHVAAHGRVRRLDLGQANGRPFAINIGLGFDAAVVHAVQPWLKRLIGTAAYVAHGLAALPRYRASHFRITVDDEVHEADAWLAIITNIRRYTYRWYICPGAALDDGWLDLCVFRSASLRQTAGQVVSVLTSRHVGRRGVTHYRGRRFLFEADPPVPVQLDGDPAGLTPVEVEVVPHSLSLVVP